MFDRDKSPHIECAVVFLGFHIKSLRTKHVPSAHSAVSQQFHRMLSFAALPSCKIQAPLLQN